MYKKSNQKIINETDSSTDFVEDLIAEKGGNGNKKKQDKNPNKYRKF